jgi:hypothetical protein
LQKKLNKPFPFAVGKGVAGVGNAWRGIPSANKFTLFLIKYDF